MNPLTLGMDGLLAALLLAALVTGLRLNGRLKALRDGQIGFAKAVGELNQAADKADNALRALHSASEEAHDTLLTRIETARGLLLRLEKGCDLAQKAAVRAEESALRAPVSAPAPTTPIPGSHAMTPPPPMGLRRSLDELLAARDQRPTPAAVAAPAPVEDRFDGPAPLAPRRRPIADEDLFAEERGRSASALRPMIMDRRR